VVGTEPRTGLFAVNGTTFDGGCVHFLRRSVDIRVGQCCHTRTKLSSS